MSEARKPSTEEPMERKTPTVADAPADERDDA